MIDAAILGPCHHWIQQRSQLGLGRDGKSGGGEEARCVIPVEAHDERRATSATSCRGLLLNSDR